MLMAFRDHILSLKSNNEKMYSEFAELEVRKQRSHVTMAKSTSR